MNKRQQTASNRQVEPQSPSTSHAFSGSESNAARQQDGGMDGRGVGDTDMSLSGSFASFILECMPFGDAVRAAMHFSSNPAVLDWAAQFTVGDVVAALQQPSDDLLKRLWPVGVGFDAEAQVVGRLAGGANVWARTAAMRSGVDQLSLDVGYKGAMGVEGMGMGIQLTNAFGEPVVAALAKTGIGLQADVRAQQETSFDLVSVIRASKNLSEQSLTDLLVHPLAPAQFLIPDMWVNRLHYMCMDDWRVDRTVTLEQGISAAVGQLDPAVHGSMMSDIGDEQPFIDLLGHVLPLMKTEMFSRIRVRLEGLDSLVLEGSLASGVTVDDLIQSVAPGVLMHPECMGPLSPLIAINTECALFWVLDLRASDLATAVDRDRSGFRAHTSTQVAGKMVKDGQFVSLAALDSMDETSPEVNPLVGHVDWSRMVEISLDEDCLLRHCPSVLRSVLGSEGVLFDRELDVRLVGRVDLLADASVDVFNQLLLGPAAVSGVSPKDVFDVVVDRAFHPDCTVPQWAIERSAELSRLVANLEFSGARIVGHVHQGLGGGAEISMGVGAEVMVRAEGGAMIDIPVDGSELKRLQLGLTGNASAA